MTQVGIVAPVVASSVDICYDNISGACPGTVVICAVHTDYGAHDAALVTPPAVLLMAPLVAQRIASAATKSMARLVTLPGTPVVALKSHLVVESCAVRSVAAVFCVSLVESV